MGDRITPRELERTSPWELIEGPKLAKVTSLSHPSPAAEPARSPFGEGIRLKETIPNYAITDSNPKDRGIADPPKAYSLPTATEFTFAMSPTPIPQRQIFHLAKRPYKTMISLFASTNPQQQQQVPSKVVWRDFVHALYNIGFEIRRLDGGTWYFEPAWNNDAPIIFRKPHSSGEMPLPMMRFYASRLARKYGWTG